MVPALSNWFWGRSTRRYHYFVITTLTFTLKGIPARPHGDGPDGHSLWPSMRSVSNEWIESSFPLRIEKYEVRQGSHWSNGIHSSQPRLSLIRVALACIAAVTECEFVCIGQGLICMICSPYIYRLCIPGNWECVYSRRSLVYKTMGRQWWWRWTTIHENAGQIFY